MLRDRKKDGTENNDRRDRVDEHADDQKSQRHENAGTHDAKTKRLDISYECCRDLEVGQAPAERRGGADAKQRNGCEARTIVQNTRQLTQ